MKIFILLIVLFILHDNDCIGQNKTDSIPTEEKSTSGIKNIYGDSDQIKPKDSKTYSSVVTKLLLKNKNLFSSGNSAFLIAKERSATGKEFLFYLLSIIILLLGIFKTFYAGYFKNIFRVFFNTSLRQNQLTDILLQARLPSLIFNIFFLITSGLYTWLILNYYQLLPFQNKKILIPISVAALGIIYTGKFFALKFVGWLSGMSGSSDTYIFVLFLINKIVGIILIPFIILLAFSPDSWKLSIILISFLVIAVFFLLRFYKSYGLLQNQLTISFFHFFLYIIAIEILPIFLIYKLMIRLLIVKSSWYPFTIL